MCVCEFVCVCVCVGKGTCEKETRKISHMTYGRQAAPAPRQPGGEERHVRATLRRKSCLRMQRGRGAIERTGKVARAQRGGLVRAAHPPVRVDWRVLVASSYRRTCRAGTGKVDNWAISYALSVHSVVA
jgi:hypothetical protein